LKVLHLYGYLHVPGDVGIFKQREGGYAVPTSYTSTSLQSSIGLSLRNLGFGIRIQNAGYQKDISG
jgi:hypothetical protein